MTLAQHQAAKPGSPFPLGVTLTGDGVNVAVWAPQATSVAFCLFEVDGQESRFKLTREPDDIWHGHLSGVAAGARYGFRVSRPESGSGSTPGSAPTFGKLLVDPYARELEGPLRWHPSQSLSTPDYRGIDGGNTVGNDGNDGTDPIHNSEQESDQHVCDLCDSAPSVAKCVVAGEPQGPNPAANRPGLPLNQLITYEAHVKGLTATHPGIPPHLRGTYLGMAHPVIIHHLLSLGVNAVEFLPVQSFIDDEFVVRRGLTNYWGYQPIAWFAPEPRYAYRDAVEEFRTLVHTLHAAGIEVILDVVYNHTGEGGAGGPHLCHRGFAEATYYRSDEDGNLLDFTGTGNTLNLEHPMVVRAVVESLEHWVTVHGVDGFRFDLAATLGRTSHGFSPDAPFFQAVTASEILAGVKLIAEPWDLGPNGYQRGNFPAGWSEWNDAFRDGVRRAWRGESLSAIGFDALLFDRADTTERLSVGDSADAPGSGLRAPHINFITAHDGFTLDDLVSYEHRHNLANREENRDGFGEQFSDNCGVEGPTNDAVVQQSRARRKLGMLATLLLAQGIPMLRGGDEIGNSQGGNNNAYAQDNEIGWIDWSVPDWGLFSAVQRLIHLRLRLGDALFTTHAATIVELSDHLLTVAVELGERVPPSAPSSEARAQPGDASAQPDGARSGDTMFIILNTGDDREIFLPQPEGTRGWQVELDTGRTTPTSPVTGSYLARAQSVVVLTEASSPAGQQFGVIAE